MLPANAALLLGGCLLVAHVSGQQPALVKCDSFDSSCPRGHVCDKGSGYCKSPPNQNVECDAFDGSCPKELVCDKSKHCVKSPCGGTCDVCLFMGRCVRVNKGHLASQGMCEHHKGTWCSGATTTPSPAPTLHVPPPPVVPPYQNAASRAWIRRMCPGVSRAAQDRITAMPSRRGSQNGHVAYRLENKF